MQKKQSIRSDQFKSQNILKVALCETTDLYTCSCIHVDDVIIMCFGRVICWHEIQYFLRVIKICQGNIFWSNSLLAMECLKTISNHIFFETAVFTNQPSQILVLFSKLVFSISRVCLTSYFKSDSIAQM